MTDDEFDNEFNELMEYARCPRCLGCTTVHDLQKWHWCKDCNWMQDDKDERLVWIDEDVHGDGIPEGCLFVTDGEEL